MELAPESEDIGQMFQKASLATKPILTMMTTILVVRAAEKQGIPLNDVFVGDRRQKLAAAA